MNAHFQSMRQTLGQASFWRISAILILACAVVERMWLVKAIKSEPFVVASSSSGYHVPIVEKFSEASGFHKQQAELTLQTLLNRSRGGVDSPERLRQVCTQQGYRQANEYVQKQNVEFAAKSLSQKVEIARHDILKTSDDRVIVRCEGQLLRIGVFEGKPFQEVLPFTVEMEFVFNRDLLVNNKYPTLLHQLQNSNQNQKMKILPMCIPLQRATVSR